MKAIIAIVLILLLIPVVFAVKERPAFKGLKGISGVSVDSKPTVATSFGKPQAKKEEATGTKSSLKGVAQGLGVSKAPCADFGCTPSQNIVADSSKKQYYRCYCANAKKIAAANIKCITTPSIAEKIGYKAGSC